MARKPNSTNMIEQELGSRLGTVAWRQAWDGTDGRPHSVPSPFGAMAGDDGSREPVIDLRPHALMLVETETALPQPFVGDIQCSRAFQKDFVADRGGRVVL